MAAGWAWLGSAATGGGVRAEECIKSAGGNRKGFGHYHHTAYNIGSAYALMKKASMNMRKPMADIAQAILFAGGLLTESNP